MSLNIIYVSANGTKNGSGSTDNPMDFATAVRTGGENSVIVLLNGDGPIQTSGVALYKNQYVLGEGATAVVMHNDGVTSESYTAPGSGGAQLHGTSNYNAVIGTHPETEGGAVEGVTATGGVNNAGIIAETRYNFVLSGQSNMAGWEDVKDFDPELQGVQEEVKIWTGDRFESLTPGKNTHPLEYGAAPASSWAGSELSMGANLSAALGTEVYLTKVTAGGTPISRWLDGDMLNRVFGHTLKSSEAIADQGYAPFIGGVGWNQGENDYGRYSEYDQKLLMLLSRMQNEFGIDDLRLIASGTSPHRGGAEIEKELAQAANASEFIDFFSMQHFMNYSNGTVHFDAEGYSYMGYEFAVNFLKDLMGNPVAQDDITGYIPLWLRPVAPEAIDDHAAVIAGITNDVGNVLLNDSDYNPGTLRVSAINGNAHAVGEWIELAEGGRIKIDASGNYVFEHKNAFSELGFGEAKKVVIHYDVSDQTDFHSSASLILTIYGTGEVSDITTLHGDEKNNILYGVNGNDIIYGYAGNDIIYGGKGSEIIFGGAGNDIIFAVSNGVIEDVNARHVIFGEDGNDTVYGSSGNDYIDLGEGDNVVRSYGGNDEIFAGAGNDTIYATSNNRKDDKGFTKQINSGDGRDYIESSDSDDVIIAGDGDKRIYSYGGNDSIKVGNGNNIIIAHASNLNDDAFVTKTIVSGNGRDTIEASIGDDYILVGDGNKNISTYAGNDTIITGGGNNRIDTALDRNKGSGNAVKIITGKGNDAIYTSASDDLIDAGEGNNTIYSYGGNDYIITGQGNDNIYAYSANRNNDTGLLKTIISGDGTDSIYTSYSDDTVKVGDGRKSINTYGGNDTIIAGNGEHYIDTAINRDQGKGTSTIIRLGHGQATIYTSGSDDDIQVGNGNANIATYGGNDVIFTGNGDHNIYAYASNRNDDIGATKQITLGDGRDTIYSSLSDDVITVGHGDKRIYTYGGEVDIVKTGNGNNYIETASDRRGGEGDRTFITTGDGNNTLHTSRADDTITTGNGNDTIYAYGGNNIIIAGGGNDLIVCYDVDRAKDKGKVNFIDAGNGNDTIHGTQGSDTIIGGAGNDTIYGYGGHDILLFDGDSGKDIVYNFNASEDKISFEGSGLRFDDVHLSSSGRDVILTCLDTQVTLKNVAFETLEQNTFIF